MLRISGRTFAMVLCSMLCCAALCFSQGCSGKRQIKGPGGTAAPTEGTGQPGTKPYSVQGKTYYPLLSVNGYREEGIASWYGKDFHGKQTANGEKYDMHAMTAAHKILPFNTRLRVTNLDNNRSITVRVNDRGPFVANRIIDLSRNGAEQLDMIGPGTARVRIESIGTIPGMNNGDLTGKFYIQAGAFSKRSNADALAAKLRGSGLGSRVYFSEQVRLWRVQIGPYSSISDAEKAGETLRAQYPSNFVVGE